MLEWEECVTLLPFIFLAALAGSSAATTSSAAIDPAVWPAGHRAPAQRPLRSKIASTVARGRCPVRETLQPLTEPLTKAVLRRFSAHRREPQAADSLPEARCTNSANVRFHPTEPIPTGIAKRRYGAWD
jgi:hypothetical protein